MLRVYEAHAFLAFGVSPCLRLRTRAWFAVGIRPSLATVLYLVEVLKRPCFAALLTQLHHGPLRPYQSRIDRTSADVLVVHP